MSTKPGSRVPAIVGARELLGWIDVITPALYSIKTFLSSFPAITALAATRFTLFLNHFLKFALEDDDYNDN